MDHWTDDAEAIGIAHPDNHGILAYISTSYLKESGYYVALETPTYYSVFPYQNMGSHDVKSIDALAAILLMHFSMGHISQPETKG